MFRDPIEALRLGLSGSLADSGKGDGDQWAGVSSAEWGRAASLLAIQSGLTSLVDLFAVSSERSGKKLIVIARVANPSGSVSFRLKTELPGEGGALPSIVRVYPAADWYEKESQREYGLIFQGETEASVTESMDMTDDRIDIPPEAPDFASPFGLSICVDNMRISSAQAAGGYSHRGIEKMAQSVPWSSLCALSQKIDCRSPWASASGCAMAIEALFDIAVPMRAKWIRMVLCEASRISEHMLVAGNCLSSAGIAAHAVSLFSERRGLLACLSRCFGARGHGSPVVVGGVARDLGKRSASDLKTVLGSAIQALESALDMTARDPIFHSRTRGIGVFSQHAAEAWGITGPGLRAGGSDRDSRVLISNLPYSECVWGVVKGSEGDVFDRIAVRLGEAIQSGRIIEQALAGMEPGPIVERVKGISLPARSDVYGTKEGFSEHCALIMGDAQMPRGEIYSVIEAASGELGFFVVSDGGNRPARFRVRSPSFALSQAAPMIVRGANIEDLGVIVQSLGASASEADR